MKISKKYRFGLALIALFFGLSVLGVSLVVTSNVLSTGGQSMASRKFYFASDIKPDHILYPVFMVFDRVSLEMSSPEEQVNLSLLYAQRRFDHGVELLESGDKELALSTFSKSQKYLMAALNQSDLADINDKERKRLIILVEKQTRELNLVADQKFDGSETHALKKLIKETQVLLDRVKIKE